MFHFENVRSSILFGRAVYLIAIVYVMCAIISLARFNVETEQDESAHLSFAGLPSPPAAGLIVSLVILQQDFLPKIKDWPFFSSFNFEMIAIIVLPVVTLMAGLLMVTRIPYPHVVNRTLRGKKRFSTFLLIVFTLLFIIWNIQLAMVVGFAVFMLYGLIRWLVLPSKREPPKAAPPVNES
jgi:CDP-diacylglycerol--serine O-phosphatidyltransferase